MHLRRLATLPGQACSSFGDVFSPPPFLPVIDEILSSDRKLHRKQRHTTTQILERLRDEHAYDGG